MSDLTGRPAPLGVAAELWDVLACPCPEHAPVRPDEPAAESSALHADGPTRCATASR